MPQQHLDGAQLAAFDESGAFSASQKLALRLAVALTKTPAEVSDDLFAALRSEFSEPQLVELAAAIARENSRARLNRTFAIGSRLRRRS